MEIKALVLYRDHYALYHIQYDKEGIYSAFLKRYDGNMHNLPPPTVTLTKGFRTWRGSTDEQGLVDELGEVIELNIKSGLLLREKDLDTLEEE
jgi:hypothetical protein